jgi:hypothetical protein
VTRCAFGNFKMKCRVRVEIASLTRASVFAPRFAGAQVAVSEMEREQTKRSLRTVANRHGEVQAVVNK